MIGKKLRIGPIYFITFKSLKGKGAKREPCFWRTRWADCRLGQVTPGVIMSPEAVGRQDSIPGLILRHVLVLETRQRER